MFAAWDSRGWCSGSKPGLRRLPWVVPSFLSPHWRALHNPDKQINNTTNKRRMWFKMPQLQNKNKKKIKDNNKGLSVACPPKYIKKRAPRQVRLRVSSFLPSPYPSLLPSVSAPQLRNVGHDTELFQYRQISAQQGHTHAFTTHTQ